MHQESEKITQRVGENIFKTYLKRARIHNTQGTFTIQQKGKYNPIKNGQII